MEAVATMTFLFSEVDQVATGLQFGDVGHVLDVIDDDYLTKGWRCQWVVAMSWLNASVGVR